ncbi:MAG: hypothetical protein PHT33_14305, partial [bacterium]|nr:hypothetical protein [bacterium]
NLLSYFKVGIIPGGNLTHGVEKLRRELPRLVEMVLTGWEPLPAFKALEHSSDLWLSRYGSGIGTYLVAGNGSFKDKVVEFAVDNDYLGDYVLLFADYDGRACSNSVKDRITRVKATAESREALILKALFGIRADSGITAEVAQSGGIEGGILTASINLKEAVSTEMVCRLPASSQVTDVKLNMRDIAYSVMETNGIKFKVKLEPGKNSIEVRYRSGIFHSPEDALLAFTFVRDGKPACKIVVNDNADSKEMLAAERIREYFNYYYACQDEEYLKAVRKGAAKATVSISIPIVRAGEVRDCRDLVVIGNIGTGSGVARQVSAAGGAVLKRGISLIEASNVILLTGDSPSDALNLTNEFMRLLDHKYTWTGSMPNIFKGEDREHFEKAGLMGGVLREKE